MTKKLGSKMVWKRKGGKEVSEPGLSAQETLVKLRYH